MTNEGELTAAMDTINLERALVDFEIANGRVMDLTARLTDMNRELLATRAELGLAKLRISELAGSTAELATVKGSIAYRVLRRLGDAKARLRHR